MCEAETYKCVVEACECVKGQQVGVLLVVGSRSDLLHELVIYVCYFLYRHTSLRRNLRNILSSVQILSRTCPVSLESPRRHLVS